MGEVMGIDIKNGRLLASTILGIDHVAIAVRDLEEAINWYCGLLGFQLMERRCTTGASTSMVSAVVKSGTCVVVLIQGNSPESQVSRFIAEFGPGVQHMAFAVRNMEEALSQFIANGGHADTEVIEGDGIRQVFLRRDPGSGVRIELVEKTTGNFSDDSVERLFRTFEARGLY